MKIILGLLILLFSSATFATEYRYLARSPHALLMGDAFTARADDEYVLFYNPAGMGRNSGLGLNPLNPEIGVTNALNELDRFENFPKRDSAAMAERILGLPIYIKAGVHPMIKFGPIGISLFAASTTSLVLRDAVSPVIDIDYRYDRGFVLGYAYSWGPAARQITSKGTVKKQGWRSSVGFAVKNISREGLKGEFPLFGPELIDIVNNSNSSNVTELRDALGYSKGSGWGGDVGYELSFESQFSELAFGLSVLDIADTKFRKTYGDRDIPRQDMFVNAGVSWRQDFTVFDYSINMDLKPLNVPGDYRRKIHFGFDIGLPLIRAMAGWSEGYVSYGAGIKLWPIEINLGFYDVELGGDFKEEKGSRAVIYIGLFDFSFDA